MFDKAYSWTTDSDESMEKQRQDAINFDRKMKSNGRVRGQLVIDFECYNTAEQIQIAIDDAITQVVYCDKPSASGGDDILNFIWFGKLRKGNVGAPLPK